MVAMCVSVEDFDMFLLDWRPSFPSGANLLLRLSRAAGEPTRQ